jgi:hypothetical protein
VPNTAHRPNSWLSNDKQLAGPGLPGSIVPSQSLHNHQNRLGRDQPFDNRSGGRPASQGLWPVIQPALSPSTNAQVHQASSQQPNAPRTLPPNVLAAMQALGNSQHNPALRPSNNSPYQQNLAIIPQASRAPMSAAVFANQGPPAITPSDRPSQDSPGNGNTTQAMTQLLALLVCTITRTDERGC